MKNMTFVTAMKDFFGVLPGQSVAEFLQELRKLSNEDRAWFTLHGLPSVGYNVVVQAA